MVHHGVIVAHRSVPFAIVYALYVERAVQLELALRQAGDAPALADEAARKIRDTLQTAFVIPDTWRALARTVIAHDPGDRARNRFSPEEQGSGLPSCTRRPEPLGRSVTIW